jgi:predicted CxxxxCH...CXXCH cytochrome family protein
MPMNRLALLAAAAAFTALAGCDKARTLGGSEGGGGCTTCHGGVDNQTGAPPKAVSGNPADPAIGAHTAHVVALPVTTSAGCSVCHGANPGHSGHNDSTVQIDLTGLAAGTDTPVTPVWDPGTFTCTVYCHGVTLTDGADTTPSWGQTSLAGAPCGSCHGYPPVSVSPHTAGMTSCSGCHENTGHHIDGTLQVSVGCTSCHGGTDNQTGAPPVDTHGATTSNYVGAHTTHVNAQITCAICHGPNPGATGHNLDGPRAQVVFTGVATDGGAFTTSYDPSTFTCTVYCHGGSLSGGADTTPSWPDGSLTGGCGACHGNPPLAVAPHTATTTDCAGCHPAVPGASHMNGTVDVTAHATGYSDPAVHGPDAIANIASCQVCHGTAFDAGGFAPMDCNACHSTNGWNASALTTNCTFCHGTKTLAGYPSIANPLLAAPPRAVSQNATDPAIGAHQEHLNAGTFTDAFTCDACHTVPATGDLSHITGGVTFTWGTLAAQGTTPTWDGTALTCTNYCHGATLKNDAGTVGHVSPAWTATALTCTDCHGLPPGSGGHYYGAHPTKPCNACHSTVADPASNTITAGGLSLHVNGVKDVSFAAGGTYDPSTRRCSGTGSGCHGTNTMTWPAP